MSFQIIFSPKSKKQIEKLPADIREQIKEASLEIQQDPYHRGTIKVENYDNIRRKRAGRYRILYTIDKCRKEILVVKVEKRDEHTYKLH